MFQRPRSRRGIAARRPHATPATVRPVLRVRAGARSAKKQDTPIAALAFVRPRVERLC